MKLNKKSKRERIEMKPDPNCRNCFGRGWVLVLRPDLVANIKEVRPCPCVKSLVKERPDTDAVASQFVAYSEDLDAIN